MLEALVGLGVVFAILLIVFLFNPPEAWIKKVFYRDKGRKDESK